MIKAGLDTEIIIETLTKTYIEPFISEPEIELNRKEMAGTGKSQNEKGLKGFIRFPDQKPHNPGRIRKRRCYQVLQHTGQTTEFQTGPDFSGQQDNNVSARLKIFSLAQEKCKHPSNTNEKKIPGLVYLCRLPECKSLKIWIRSSDFPAITG
jgi:hypothetical protein